MNYSTDTLAQGDAAYVRLHRYRGECPVVKRTVARVTPTGQVFLESGERFDAKGQQIGSSSKWTRSQLVSEADYLARKRRQGREAKLCSIKAQIAALNTSPWDDLPTKLRNIALAIEAYDAAT